MSLQTVLTKIGNPIIHTSKLIRRLASTSCRRYEGKVVIVTGSTEGIGLALARRFGQEGARVIVSSRTQKNVDKAVKTLENDGSAVAGIVCHVAKADHRDALINKALEFGGGLDVVVANAACNPYVGPFIETPESAWDKVMDVDLKSSFQLTQQVYPHLKKRGGGSILFMSSIVGYYPNLKFGAYSIAKTGIFTLTKLFAKELGPDHIRVNCIAPGMVETKMLTQFWNVTEQENERLKSQLIIKRIGQPEDITGAAAFLCSNDAEYITGEILCITGGFSNHI
ncbi:Dehydrogenase reductase SDR member 4 [Chamberlinius hualienensis]